MFTDLFECNAYQISYEIEGDSMDSRLLEPLT